MKNPLRKTITDAPAAQCITPVKQGELTQFGVSWYGRAVEDINPGDFMVMTKGRRVRRARTPRRVWWFVKSDVIDPSKSLFETKSPT